LSCCRNYNQQIITYDQIAISTYLYLTANSPLIPHEIAIENFLYVLRYFGFELVKCSEQTSIEKGDGDVENIIHNLHKLPNTKRLIDLFNNANIESRNINKTTGLAKLFEEYFLIRDSMYRKFINE
jgi:hypothetical protein